MMFIWVLLGTLCAATFNLCMATSYVQSGLCTNKNESSYKYHAWEVTFGKYDHTFEITVNFKLFCVNVGKYGDQNATLYEMDITNSVLGGNIVDRTSNDTEGKLYSLEPKGWLQFVQTEDGTIPITFFSREEDHEIVNIKKAIVSAFQASLKGKVVKEESDPQSHHNSTYRSTASIQDMKNGVLKMTRTINSSDVIDYASHIPEEEVHLDKKETIVYANGNLKSGTGVSKCELMPENTTWAENSTERDSLEHEKQNFRKRSTNETITSEPNGGQPSYNDTIKTNYYKAEGNYSLEYQAQRRLLNQRRRRSSNSTVKVEASLLAYINQTRKDLEKMMKLRYSLKDIQQSLEDLYSNPMKNTIAHQVQSLVKLEAKYGPLPEFPPAIDDVLDYFESLIGSNSTRDMKMRFHLYFIMSPEGSLPSQLALVQGYESAVNIEEKETVIIYISMLTSPHPQIVAKLESLISSDVHSSDPLLLAYSAIVSRAKPELQQRMTLFLTNRLPQAETNSTSLIHHILSLGNTASPKVVSFLVNYLQHSRLEIQLASIFAMRFLMSEPLIQVSLKNLVSLPETGEDHLVMIVKALLYGVEKAKLGYQEKPYSSDLANALVLLAVNIDNEELHSALSSYLKKINTHHAMNLLQLLKDQHHSGNELHIARHRRDTTWDESNSAYDLVEPLTERQSDVKKYTNKLSYIWGKKFGGKDIHADVAAGGFAGVADSGSYKLFAHAVAKVTCYDYSLTILEFLVLREKDETSTISRLYANIMGTTVKNVNDKDNSTVCKNLNEPVFEGKEYTIFDFTYSIFVVVGTLNFHLTATAEFTTGMYVRFCDAQGKLQLGAGLSPTLTVTVSASGDLEVALVAKAGITLAAVFNYQLLPEATSELCYKNSKVQINNCLAVYHQWENNKLELYVWYAWRGWCGWWACTGKDAYKKIHKIDALSFKWNLPSSKKTAIWKGCDNKNYSC